MYMTHYMEMHACAVVPRPFSRPLSKGLGMRLLRADSEHWDAVSLSLCVQEQSSRREIGDLERQVKSNEADFQNTLQQGNSELETLRSKVGLSSPESVPPKSLCMNTATCTPVTVTPPSIFRYKDLIFHLPRPVNSALILPLN